MRYYDLEKAKEIITNAIPSGLVLVCMGMQGDWDWDWTSTIVWTKEDGLQENFEEGPTWGPRGSSWATPVVHLFFEDGGFLSYDCYYETIWPERD